MSQEEAALRAHAIWCAKLYRIAMREVRLLEDSRSILRSQSEALAYKNAFQNAKTRIRLLKSKVPEAVKFATSV